MSANGFCHSALRAARGAADRAIGALSHGGVAILGLCGIGLVWAGILHSLAAGREATIHGAYLNAANLARAFDETLVRSIRSVDQTLIEARDAYTLDPENFDIRAWAARTRAVTDVTPRISLIDKHGMLIASSLTPAGTRMDLSDREHFRAQRDNPRDELYISRPLRLRSTNEWSIQFARKLTGPDGSFAGVVDISVDPHFLSEYYRSVDLGRRGIVVLLGEDGIFRGRAGGIDQLGDEVIGRPAPGSPILAAFRAAREGFFAAPAAVDGVMRLYAYRGVRGFPLVLAVGFDRDEVLASYYDNRRAYFILGALVTGLLLAATAVLMARQAHMNRARARLRADYALKSELLEKTLENMNQGIMMIDGGGRVQVCNQRVVEKLDLPPALMARKPDFANVLRAMWDQGEFGHGGETFETWLARFMAGPAASEAFWVGEHTRPNGTVLEIRARLMPDGGYVRTYSDITERKRNEEMLREARDEARRATRAKSAFLATMSHEIRSPMSGLMGVLELLRATALDEEQTRMAGMVHHSASMLLAVLNDVLDFSKIEAGALSITPEPTDPRALIGGLMAPRIASGRHKGLDVTLSIAPHIPAWISTDGLRVCQIVGNLLSNAIKFTAAGRIAVTVALEHAADAAMLRLDVRDTGIGMSADVLARLFQPFMQADGSTTRGFGGTGLGLSISEQLARLLGGTLSVTSTPGVGSVFTLRVPCVPCAAPGTAAAASAAVPGPLVATRADSRALVVDDDPTNRWLAQRQLTHLGFSVDVADDGEGGLAALLAAPYTLMVTDCHMPRMDGVALTRAVRAMPDPSRRDMPIIGLTADATAAQRERCHEAGMTDLAIKPLTIERLAALVSRVLASAPAAAPSTGTAGSLKSLDFDDQIFLEIFAPGDADGAKWLRDYVRAAQRDLDELRDLVEIGADMAYRPDEVARVAHRLAGASFSVGAMLLGESARALEHAAPHAVRSGVAALHRALRERFDAAADAITRFLSDVPDPHAGAGDQTAELVF